MRAVVGGYGGGLTATRAGWQGCGVSLYANLDRPPLSETGLGRALTRTTGPGSPLWTDVRVVGETGSTNADVAAARGGKAPRRGW
ncbi:hypothetical protein [Fodinicola feengrottensis]|uniref:hypothetical protein n=1 Tax=Fodinicola feengrottensis TaxID=435914 RepID=UPI0024428FA4|nr:hypothetical protein [Fodinicola feengrottensis]